MDQSQEIASQSIGKATVPPARIGFMDSPERS